MSLKKEIEGVFNTQCKVILDTLDLFLTTLFISSMTFIRL